MKQRRRRTGAPSEAGAAAVIMAIFVAAVMIPIGAIGVDIARWYVEAERVQAAADAAATAGVTYMPDDFAKAKARALEIAEDNGFANSGGTVVTVEQGQKPTQLKVTVSSPVRNQFGQVFGVDRTSMSRSAVADFNGPAPMGSPCNTFGNEPAGSSASGPIGSVIKAPPLANCPQAPEFWASISGPEVAKDQGSQFEARKCWGGEDECANGSRGAANNEFDPRGYIYLVRISDEAVGRNVRLQIYDPATVASRANCAVAPTSNISSNTPNNWVQDAIARYRRLATTFCTGDDASSSRRFGSASPTITSFGLRAPIDTMSPHQAPPMPHCAKQFKGYDEGYVTTGRLTQGGGGWWGGGGSYDAELASVFHQWVTLCDFVPTRAGDHYLQVRTNVPLGNAQAVFTQAGDNAAAKGNSINSFALRAVSDAPAGAVSVTAWDRMRIFANADAATTTFNLVRVIPAAATKTLAVSFFDVGEGSSSGSVRLIPPADSNLTYASNCEAKGVKTGILSNCKISNITATAYNGKLQFIRVPIPSTYTCDTTTQGGCWWRAEVSFGSGAVTDATTWTANIEGEPIRLVE